MATRRTVSDPVSAAPTSAQVATPAPAAAPAPATAPASTSTGFNMPRLVAKPVKVVEEPSVATGGGRYTVEDKITLAGVQRGAAKAVDAAKPTIKAITDTF